MAKTKNEAIVEAIVHEVKGTEPVHTPVPFALTLDPDIRVYGNEAERRVLLYEKEIGYLMRICPQLDIRERIARRTRNLESSRDGDYGPLFKIYMPEEGPYMVPTKFDSTIRHDLLDALFILWHSKFLMNRFWPAMADNTGEAGQEWFNQRRAPGAPPVAAPPTIDVA